MIEPGVAAGVIQRRYDARVRIDGRDVRALLLIAANTRQAEVVDLVGTSVLATHDVIDLVRQHGCVFRKSAILACISCTLPDELASFAG